MNNITIETLKGQLDNRIEKKLQNVLPPTANDISNTLDEETIAYNKLKEDMFEKRNYINRENLLIVNSGDRDWFTESEDRYAFQMRFDPTRDSYELVPKIDSTNGLTVMLK